MGPNRILSKLCSFFFEFWIKIKAIQHSTLTTILRFANVEHDGWVVKSVDFSVSDACKHSNCGISCSKASVSCCQKHNTFIHFQSIFWQTVTNGSYCHLLEWLVCNRLTITASIHRIAIILFCSANRINRPKPGNVLLSFWFHDAFALFHFVEISKHNIDFTVTGWHSSKSKGFFFLFTNRVAMCTLFYIQDSCDMIRVINVLPLSLALHSKCVIV